MMKTIKAKLIFGMLVACFFVTVALTGAAYVSLRKLGENSGHEITYNATKTTFGILTDIQTRLRVYTATLSYSSDIVAAVATNNTQDLEKGLTFAFKQLHEIDEVVKTIEVTDANGIIIMRGHNPAKKGDNKSSHAMVKQALAGTPSHGLTVSPTTGEMAQDSVYPLFAGKKVVGTIKVGSYFREDTANMLKKLTGTEIAIFANGKLNIITIKDVKNFQLDSSLVGKSMSEPVIISTTLSGVNYNVGYVSLVNSENNTSAILACMVPLASTENHVKNSLVIALALAVIVIAIILGATLWFARYITNPILHVSEALNASSMKVADASGQISGSSQSLAEGATEQASSLEETSSALEEMASMTRQNADNANAASSIAREARGEAEKGNKAMGDMIVAMKAINSSSQEISKIIKVIEEIAFQTNLLALNAAVEAARAGEHGKGFAVVAEEVRNLAQRSATAAKDTSALIEDAVKKASDGGELADRAGQVLESIVESVKKVTDLVAEISAASNEQAQGVDQVNTAVSRMDKVTQQNAANAEETAAASEELSAQAETLDDIVSDLMMIVHGTGEHETKAVVSHVAKPAKTPAKRLFKILPR